MLRACRMGTECGPIGPLAARKDAEARRDAAKREGKTTAAQLPARSYWVEGLMRAL